MKKILSILLAVAMLLSMFALVACDKGNQGNQGNEGNEGNNGTDGKPAGMASFDVPEVGYDGSAVTVVFYHSMGAKLQGVLNTYIPELCPAQDRGSRRCKGREAPLPQR